MSEQVIEEQRFQSERKSFVLTFRENSAGRMLRITEESGGRFNTIIIPAAGLRDLKKVIDDVVDKHDL